MKSRFKRFLITYDLDVEGEVEIHLKDIGLLKGKDYLPVGKNTPGKQCVEGLVPASTFQKVFSGNVELVQKATFGIGSEAKSAKSSLKGLYYDEFQRTATALSDDYKDFYALTKQLNKMLSKP